MKTVRAPIVAAVLLVASALATGCVSVPKFSPDHVGLSDLPLLRPDLPPYPSAASLLVEDPSTDGVERPRYRVGPLDDVVVSVWGRPDLGSQVPIGQSGALRASGIREDGTIVLPFLAPIKVAGMTVEQMQSAIRTAYARIIENPQIEVRLHECGSQSVDVGGAVSNPGTYVLCVDLLTVGEVLTAARGFRMDTDLSRGILNRAGQFYHLDYRESERAESRVSEVPLRGGDKIYFPSVEERSVYVFGEVRRQGVFEIPPTGMTLLDVLGRARGIDTVTAQHQGIYLMRRKGPQYEVYKLKLADILQGPAVPVADGDRLFVAVGTLERWDRWWRKALPFTNLRPADIQILTEE